MKVSGKYLGHLYVSLLCVEPEGTVIWAHAGLPEWPNWPKNSQKWAKKDIWCQFIQIWPHVCSFDIKLPKVPNFHIFLRVLDFFGLRTRFGPVTTISFWSPFDPYFWHVQTRHRIGTVYGQKWMGKLSGSFFSMQNITVHPPMTQRRPLRGQNLGQTARKTTQNNRISAQNCPKIKHI